MRLAALASTPTAVLLMGCDEPPHDPLFALDMLPEDLSATAPVDLAVQPSLLLTGHYFLAEEAQADKLFACRIIGPRGFSPIHLVSISTSDGALTPLYDDETSIINIIHADSDRVYWMQHDVGGGGKALLRSVSLSATVPTATLLFDATSEIGVTNGYTLQNFILSPTSPVLYVLLSDGKNFELGSVPRGGGAYAKLVNGTYPGSKSVSFGVGSRDTLAALDDDVYVIGQAAFTFGAPQGFVAKLAVKTAVSSVVWNKDNAAPHAITAAFGRVYWGDELGTLFGYDVASDHAAIAGTLSATAQQLTAFGGKLYAASYTDPPPTMVLARITPPATLDGSAMPFVLHSLSECVDADMGCVAKSPTFAIAGQALFHTTTDGLYRISP